MSSSNLWTSDLLKEVDRRIKAWGKTFRPDLRQTTGTLPGTQLPTGGPTGTGYPPADTSVSTAKLQDDSVTFAKMQNLSTDRLMGRDTASTGDPEQIALDSTLEFTGSGSIRRAALTGDIAASAGSNSTTLASSGVSAATYGDATHSAQITVDAKGRITSASNVSISGVGGASLTIEEADGSPTESAPTKLIFPNGTLSVGSHEVTYTPTGGGGATSTGALGSEPGSPTAGDLYLSNTLPIIERYSGSAWAPFGPLAALTTPPSSGWSWVNQGTGTVSTTGGPIVLTSVATTGDDIRAYVRTAPTPPYTITACIRHNLTAVAGAYCGLCWRESSSGKLITFQLQSTNQMRIIRWTNPTTYGGAVDLDEAPPSWSLEWVRLEETTTDRKVWIAGEGQNWVLLHSIGRTTFLTANQVGIVANSASTTRDLTLSLLSWG